MSSDDPIYNPGDVVFGADPFKDDDASRPWLIVSNHEDKPFYGEQYIALTLTTRSWMDDLIEIRTLHGFTVGHRNGVVSLRGVSNRLLPTMSTTGKVQFKPS